MRNKENIMKANTTNKNFTLNFFDKKICGSKKAFAMANQGSKNQGHTIEFDVLYYAKSKKHKDLEEVLAQKEGELIRQHMPMLNT